ncbi:ornithine cyclodeaminase [Achromobacter aloeverae]|uniref:Ornithine cyclodeaminase n=1 Tax=Achromobacter aloeverae TaxID=1750518 RepID=A0A4Q1HQI2_9BURK|nr:ornithine cyclodeaminase [Achromobacter aloeverae]RXN92951.1 ornithine cyclodeaminase [Achromobacter aloeverae]
MTRFIDVPQLAALVRAIGPGRFMTELADAIQADYLRWNDFDKTPRVAAHSARGVIELMPVADRVRYTFKYVNGHPSNTATGLPTVMAFGALADVDTGYPRLLSELTLMTALRTAATSAMAARILARHGSRRMALIGNGAQSEFQAIAFHTLLGIKEVRLYDIDPAATAKLRRNLAQAAPGLAVSCAASTAQAVRGADIVTTVTADKAYATILTPEMMEPGMHINAVGGDCPGKTELHADILGAARVVVEYEPQSRIEGEIQQMPADFPVVELWRVLDGSVAGRESDGQVTVFDSVGFALEDYSALCYLDRLAQAHGIGTLVQLVPPAGDPKNLFGVTLANTNSTMHPNPAGQAPVALSGQQRLSAAA